eukprot:gene8723-671_t
MSFSEILSDNLIDIVDYLPPKDAENWFISSKKFQKHQELYWQHFFKNQSIKKPSKNCIFTLKQYYYQIYLKKDDFSDILIYERVCENILDYQEQEEGLVLWKKMEYFQMIKLVVQDNKEEYFDDIFASIHSKQLRNVFVMKLYELMNNENSTKEEIEKIQSTIIKILESWILFDYDSGMNTIKLVEEKFRNQFEKHDFKLNFLDIMKTKKKNERIQIFEGDAPKSIFPKTFTSILDFKPVEFARQLTMIDSEIYHSIEKIELCSGSWMKFDSSKEQNSPNVLRAITLFNEVCSLVQVLLLKESKLMKRANILKFFLETVIELKKINSFNLLMSLISGLQTAPVHRLKETWAFVPTKLKSQFEAILEIADGSHSYYKLRNIMNSSNGNVIPYVGIFLTDLVFIEDGNETFTPLINCTKRKLRVGAINRVLKFQNSKHNFKINKKFQEILQQEFEDAKQFDEKTCYQMSLEIEPRGRKLKK